MSAATRWVRELARQQRLPVPWGRMLRVAVAVAVPVSIGAAIGQLGLGLLVSIGALGGSLADAEGPVLPRVVRAGWATAGGVAGFVVGGLVFGQPALTAASVIAGGLLAGLVSVHGAVASVASLQFLIYLIVASGADFGPIPHWLPPAGYVIGSAWALLLALIEGIGAPNAPGRDVVADVYARMADYMDAAGTPRAEDARRDLTTALNRAYDTVKASRANVGGSDRHIRRQGAFLNAATPVIEATTARAVAGIPIPAEIAAWVRDMADRIRRTDPPAVDEAIGLPVLRAPEWRDVAEGLDAVDELARHRTRAGAAVTGPSPITRAMRLPGAPPPRPPARVRLMGIWDALAGGAETWLPTLRLVLCLAAGEIVAALDPAQRPYWIVMTIAVTLKPDFGSVFARAVQRGVGTVVGVLIGSALLALSPGHAVPLVAIAVFAALMPFAQRRNYGMFTTFLTPVIVMLLDLGVGGGFQLAIGRVTDTAVGCAIVLLVGYLPWSDTWRSRLRFGPRIDRAARALAAYIRIGLGAGTGTRQTVRRQAYRQLSDLRTALQQALSEPPPVSRAAAGWWPVIVTLERAVDATTALIVRPRAAAPEAAGVEQLAAAADAIGAAAREGAVRDAPPLPRDPALEPVTSELRAALAVLRRADAAPT